MNSDVIINFINIVNKYSPKSFINHNFELIVVPKNNIYLSLQGIETEFDLKCKILAWLSRPSCKGISYYWQKRVRNIINEFLGTEFTANEMSIIYSYLGNDCNRKRTIRFIESNYNLNILIN